MKKTKLLLAAIVGITGNVIAVASACFAWYTGIRARDYSADTITVTQTEDAQINGITIYYWDEDRAEGKSIEVSSMDEINKADFSLEEYDTYITSRNPKKAKFLKFNLSILNVPHETKAFKSIISCASDTYTKDSKNEWISNILNFGFFNNNAKTIPTDGTDLTAIYNACLTNVTYSSVFVDTGGETAASAAMTKTSVITSGTNIQLEAETTSLELIVGYNYSSTLVSYYYNKVGKSESTILNGGELIEFDKDITSIKFNF